jgi:peptide chain release factor 2/peptide chain release factor
VTGHVVQITSGVGPTEARRFVFQLAARLEGLCEQRGLVVHDVVASSDDDAPRSITLHVGGDAPALLYDQIGSHVLIRRSPDRGRAARKRWFAAVTVHPLRPASSAMVVARDDLVVTACRAGGPGGQHVNKVSSAVRVHHLPSGLSVRSAGHRSQKANLDHAIGRLEGLLAERAAAGAAAADRARRLAHYRVERGQAVCSYQLSDDGELIARP